MGPKWSQKSPKVTQVAPKRGPKWTLKAKLAPRASQIPPEGHFWIDFGAFFAEFWVIFWTFAVLFLCVGPATIDL